MKKAQAGFTLIELLVTVVLVAILTAIAIPSFRSIIQSNRAAAFANEFISAVYFARSEAIRRGTPITLCASSNTTQTVCGASSNWPNGWIIFNDPNGDGVIASSTDRLKIRETLPTGNTITTTASRITFSQSGFVTVGAAVYTLAASGCIGKNGRTVDVKASGRVVVSHATCP